MYNTVNDIFQNTLEWKNICQDCSLTPTKQKKRYWLWKWKGTLGEWNITNAYLDNEGLMTNGKTYLCSWKDRESIKCEENFIDIEV